MVIEKLMDEILGRKYSPILLDELQVTRNSTFSSVNHDVVLKLFAVIHLCGRYWKASKLFIKKNTVFFIFKILVKQKIDISHLNWSPQINLCPHLCPQVKWQHCLTEHLGSGNVCEPRADFLPETRNCLLDPFVFISKPCLLFLPSYLTYLSFIFSFLSDVLPALNIEKMWFNRYSNLWTPTVNPIQIKTINRVGFIHGFTNLFPFPIIISIPKIYAFLS